MGSVVLDDVIIKEGVFVGVASLVLSDEILGSGYMYLGLSVKKIRHISNKKQDMLRNVTHYVRTKNKY